jgi:hypothetical protein
MAICGSTCAITNSAFSTVQGHKFTIDLGSNEIDIRAFGSGEYGNFIACAKNGTIVVESYLRPPVDAGDTLTVAASVGTEGFSIPA